MNRAVVLLAVLIFFFSAVGAETYDFPEVTAEYDSELDFKIGCTPADECDSVVFDTCWNSAGTMSYDEASEEYSFTIPNTVPEEQPCNYGDHPIRLTVDDTTVVEGGRFTIKEKNMDGHSGEALFVELDLHHDVVRDFMLTDDPETFYDRWKNLDAPSGDGGPYLLLQDTDWGTGDSADDIGWFELKPGTIIEPGSSEIATDADIKDSEIRNNQYIGDDCGDGNCADDVLAHEFSSDYWFMTDQGYDDPAIEGCDTFKSTFSSCSPVHRTNSYNPEGEIIVAAEPEPGTTYDANYEFHICREDNLGPSGTGKVVDTLPHREDGLFKCDTGGDFDWKDNRESQTGYGKWVPVTQCMDDLDNDEDENIDHDGHNWQPKDPGCEGSPETSSESGGTTCEPFVGTLDDPDDPIQDGMKGAFYNVNSDGERTPHENSCNYDNFKQFPDNSGSSPEQFQCMYNSNFGEMLVENYDGSNAEDAKTFCWNQRGGTGFAQNPMPAVQYAVPKEVMPIGTKWANEDGFGNSWDGAYGFQTLHSAEKTYGEYQLPHYLSVWENKNMINLEGYENDNYPVEDAWGVSNAGGINNEDVLYPDSEFGEPTLNDEDVFKGGFHGECTSAAQWLSAEGEWLCDIGSYEPETLTVNGYMLDAGSTANRLAGFQINWSEMKNWEDAHPGTPPDGSVSGADPVNVEAMCWQGSQNERPVSLTNVVNISATVNNGEDTYVVGELPENPDAADSNSYSCVFGISQWAEPEYVVSETNLYDGGNLVTNDVDPGYITEGTNDDQKGRVSTTSESIRPSENDPDVESMQTWLEGKEANTVSQVWTHFIKSSNKQDNRNPWLNCVQNEETNCAIAGN